MKRLIILYLVRNQFALLVVVRFTCNCQLCQLFTCLSFEYSIVTCISIANDQYSSITIRQNKIKLSSTSNTHWIIWHRDFIFDRCYLQITRRCVHFLRLLHSHILDKHRLTRYIWSRRHFPSSSQLHLNDNRRINFTENLDNSWTKQRLSLCDQICLDLA